MDENTAQGVERRFAGEPGDFDILEAVVGETWYVVREEPLRI